VGLFIAPQATKHPPSHRHDGKNHRHDGVQKNQPSKIPPYATNANENLQQIALRKFAEAFKNCQVASRSNVFNSH
jgi:hypothetical protein